MRWQFHHDAAAWQAASDEGAVAVLNSVRDEARKLPEPSTKAEVVVVTLDEMWHFVKKD